MATSPRLRLRHAYSYCQAAQLQARPLGLGRILSGATGNPTTTTNGVLLPRVVQQQQHRQHGTSIARGVAETSIARTDIITEHPKNNVTDTIFQKLGVNLHHRKDHPLGIIKEAIFQYFEQKEPGNFKLFDDLYPVVTTKQNFDELLIPGDHISRSENDTYYVDSESVLRCHTSAHQAELLREKHKNFLVIGDVYRRDTIDATHYPVFHQMEGVKIFDPKDWEESGVSAVEYVEEDLKKTLEGLAKHLFGDVECRWVDAYFPFTDPSIELEIFFNNEWLEVLGCGVMQQKILDDNYGEGQKAWAFGLGIERLAMILFDIPDIRLFWSDDERFLKQFKAGDLSSKFKSFSKFPPCNKDLSFWISDTFTENNLCEAIRGIAGDIVEEVKLIDEFTNPKKVSFLHRFSLLSSPPPWKKPLLISLFLKPVACLLFGLGPGKDKPLL